MASSNIAQEGAASRPRVSPHIPRRGLQAAIETLTGGRLSLDHLWLLMAVAALFIMLSGVTVRPSDFWWHIRMGQVILTTGHIPTTDFLTFTQTGQPWMNQSWLMQILLYLLYQVGELPLVIFAHTMTISAGYILVMLACLATPAVGARATALATVCAVALGLLHWGVRPQSASFLCFGLLVYSIERHRLKGGRVVWIWPVLFALWANLHGAFIFGPALLGIYIACRVAEDLFSKRRISPDVARALVAGVAAVAAIALNPAGAAGMASYLRNLLVNNSVVNGVVEYKPLSIREIDGAIFVGLMVGFIFLTAYRRTRLSWNQIIVLVLFGVGSLYTRRLLPWFGMAAAPTFALALASGHDMLGQDQAARPGAPLLNYAVAGLMLTVALLFLPWFRPLLSAAIPLPPYADVATTPTRAAEIVCQLEPEPRVFNDMAYGSYLAWACPDLPLFIDTRIELYPAAQWQDHNRIVNAQFDWDARLRGYGVNTLFVQKKAEKELVAAATASREWTTLYEDDYAVVMRRIEP